MANDGDELALQKSQGWYNQYSSYQGAVPYPAYCRSGNTMHQHQHQQQHPHPSQQYHQQHAQHLQPQNYHQQQHTAQQQYYPTHSFTHYDESSPEGATPVSDRRDSFPSGQSSIPRYIQKPTATPLQPPAHMYNGPPVSALVPRFPRVYPGLTPSTCGGGDLSGDGKDKSSRSRANKNKDRRTSFGFPLISSTMHPTPQVGEDLSPPTKPTDDNIRMKDDRGPSHSPEELLMALQGNPLQERTRQTNTLLSRQFEQSENKSDALKKSAPGTPLMLKIQSTRPAGAVENTAPPTNCREAEVLQDVLLSKVASTTDISFPKSCFPAKVPKHYPKRLSLRNDHIKLNSLHCFVRSELLEIFVVEAKNQNLKFRHAPSSSVGRVGLRCVHCALARRDNEPRDDEAPMAVFYPKSVSEIYRLVTSWQRCHARKCKSLPPTIRRQWEALRETEKSRGKTAYWTESAKEIGMVDCPSRAGGIRFVLPDNDGNSDEDDDDDRSGGTMVEAAKALVSITSIKKEGTDENKAP